MQLSTPPAKKGEVSKGVQKSIKRAVLLGYIHENDCHQCKISQFYCQNGLGQNLSPVIFPVYTIGGKENGQWSLKGTVFSVPQASQKTENPRWSFPHPLSSYFVSSPRSSPRDERSPARTPPPSSAAPPAPSATSPTPTTAAGPGGRSARATRTGGAT